MTTATSAQLVDLANENGGAFGVQPGQQQAGEIVDQPGLDVFGQVYNQWKNKECVCPNCSRSIAASRFAPHLEKCLGMGRNSSRIANRRIVTGNNTNNKSESDQEDNDDVNDNDWSYGAEKKGDALERLDVTQKLTRTASKTNQDNEAHAPPKDSYIASSRPVGRDWG
ncbi:hypothetical protein XENOCAPTIV_018972 [Xenoophorus captivus]|uniref:SAGA-associated factor 11 n=1 Tax=Xenoophorus captivus TaxID=1517983 RepID=A0ABV0RJQ1_9TELE